MIEDAAGIQRLIQASPPLDVNSTYAYLLLCRHFRDTCVVATRQGQLAGFVSAYFPPTQSNVLFIWQVAVHPDARGCRLGQRMLEHLLARPLTQSVASLETTVSPSNQPSRRMFAALARARGAACVEESMFPPELFGQADHEDERLLRIAPL
ncbi:L-2,4-diaminobutyric acid acetyltransferase [Pigmentiphaga humi]|uniref:L-2,4-diaminobutyric acid acetyltransferase n=1 Tax=Pigmentiphaga humi TaxID=2478468 RepID=A0A3P4B0K4_9BURK|nr:diaminobutyrate acetyltransferase [Pigmentiphaga humi]VCU69096.1 L-2,4-diaminobutyric acid acetyltransferase [Pigmentiphaga humi]